MIFDNLNDWLHRLTGLELGCWQLSLQCIFSPLVHPVVDNRIDAAVEHGQPVEEEVHVLGVPGSHDARVEVGDDEVDMVGQPTDGKYQSDCTKHFNNLKQLKTSTL